MPYTLSHPLAIVPFRRCCPIALNFSALVVGSMSPDFGYFINQFPAAGFAHTFTGSLAVCLPAGLLALGIFYMLRRPLCFILPQPHRAALTPLASVPPPLSVRGLLIAAVSVLIGAWTHIVWDSFTHLHGWTVRQFEILRAPLIHVGDHAILTYTVLQHSSTMVGGAGLILMYLLWLRRQPIALPPEADSSSDRWRYCLLGTIAIATLAFAMTVAFWKVSHLEGATVFHEFVFQAAVYSIAAFFPLLAVSSIVAYATRHRNL